MAQITQNYDPFKAKQEALKNLSQQERERVASEKTSAVQSGAGGVKSIAKGYQEVGQKAEDLTKDVAAKEFQFDMPTISTPGVEQPKGAAKLDPNTYEQVHVQLLTPEERADPVKVQEAVDKGRKAYNDAVNKIQKKQQDDIVSQDTALRKDLAGKIDSYREFMEKVRESTVARGVSGQLSEVQEQDRYLAEVMTNPNVPVGDIATLAQSVTNYDSRMSSLYAGVLGGQLRNAQAEALAALSEMGRAETEKDMRAAGAIEAVDTQTEKIPGLDEDYSAKVDAARALAEKGIIKPSDEKSKIDVTKAATDQQKKNWEVGQLPQIQALIDTVAQGNLSPKQYEGKSAAEVSRDFSQSQQSELLKYAPNTFSDRTGRIDPNKPSMRKLTEIINNPKISAEAKRPAQETLNYLNSLVYTQQAGNNASGDKAWVHVVKDPSGKVVARWYSRR